ncbi:MAG: hypothetical protein O7D30_10245 [Rickettsia endosymbiont of Ixodes persulcatus]|nr:hypothetical protein [Rickettsia endosymbiont of Ixodes persulcatus]
MLYLYYFISKASSDALNEGESKKVRIANNAREASWMSTAIVIL